MKKTTMSFEEFFEKDKNLTIDKKDIKTLDKIAGEVLNNKKLKMAVLTSIAYTNMTIMAYADGLDGLRSAKEEVIIALQICIIIICIIMCLLNIAKSLIGGRNSDIGEIVMKYLSATLATCLVPKIFAWIANLCKINI